MTISRSSPVTRDIAMATETNPADRTTLSAGAGLSIFVAKNRYFPISSKKCAMVIMPV